MKFLNFEKSAKILRISGLWHLFKNWEIPLLSTLAGHVKGQSFFHTGVV
jgi:hypothetical protein